MAEESEQQSEAPPTAGLFVGRYPLLATRMFNVPLLIEQSAMNGVLTALSDRMEFEVAAPAVLPTRGETMAATMGGKRSDAGYMIVNRTAVIPITGKLVHRGGFMDAMSGVQSYQATAAMFDAAMGDPDVSRIVLEVDSPGGEVAGAFDLADHIFASRGDKPITAVATEMAASAAYLMASAADEIVLPRTGKVGSIGVLTAHVDRSGAMKKAGVAVTYIFAGDKKVDGNPAGPLPDRVRAELQGDIDQMYDLFVSSVAKYRGAHISADAVRATQAGMYLGQAAIGAGLADHMDTFANVVQNAPRSIAVRKGSRSSPHSQSQENPMTDAEKAAAEKAQLEAINSAKAEGSKAGAAAERTRIQSIITHANAEGRETLAQHLAFDSDMTADAAVALLDKTPKAKAEKADAKETPLERAMRMQGTPNISGAAASDDDEPRQPQKATIVSSSIFDARRKAAEAARG